MFFTLFLFYMPKLPHVVSKIEDFCATLECGDSVPICGIREERDGYRLRMFDSECDLLKYGCNVTSILAYGAISMDYCDRTFGNSTQLPTYDDSKKHCAEFDCSYPDDAKQVCGIRKDGEGFRIRLFENKCELRKHNCENDVTFTQSEIHICNGSNDDLPKPLETKSPVTPKKNVILVDSSMINSNNYNKSIENFFAATHVFDLPVREINEEYTEMNETTRRRLISVFRPVKVFTPWTKIPKQFNEDIYHLPTISTCFHKCPTKCPDTYAPVCSAPGTIAREPHLMFQNHCYMDVAQCKMYWEDKSETAQSSTYIESSFVFCLGHELSSAYRFLPLIRTLQHMGRLKKKGVFRYKFSNMRFFNNFLNQQPNLMG